MLGDEGDGLQSGPASTASEVAIEELWSSLRDHFEADDGSLPDVYVEDLSPTEVCAIYSWVRTLAGIYGEPTFWDETQQSNVLIAEIENPAQLVVDEKTCSFRHGLNRFELNGVEFPQLTVAVSADSVSFDYRMGSDWGPKQLWAFLTFLRRVQQMAPTAEITHSHEGMDRPTEAFTAAFEKFKERDVSR